MERKTSSSGRGSVSYWKEGDSGECIVFTHGLAMDHTMFGKQADYFKGRYRVICWDVPLHGESRPYKDFCLKNAADELKSILDAEGISSAHLVGHSMGGYITQEFAIRYPRRALSIISVDSNPFGHEYYSWFERVVLANIMPILGWLPYKLLISVIAGNISVTEAAKRFVLDTLSKFTKNEIVNILYNVYSDMLKRDRKNHFDQPVLVVYGDCDITGTVKKCCEKWAKAEKYATAVVTNAAHMSNVDNPYEFNKILEKFLTSVH